MNKYLPVLVLLSTIFLSGCESLQQMVFNKPDLEDSHQEEDQLLFHEHSDIFIFLEDHRLDLSEDQYQSTTYEYLDPSIHHHDNNGQVAHFHKENVTIIEYLQTLGFSLTEECFIVSDEEQYCQDEKNILQVIANGRVVESGPNYEFNDLDRILIYFGPKDKEMIDGLVENVTEDSCIYSLTCPERGDPPEENCVADPNKPCVI